MRSYFNLVWAAICNREIANKLTVNGAIQFKGPGAFAGNCSIIP